MVVRSGQRTTTFLLTYVLSVILPFKEYSNGYIGKAVENQPSSSLSSSTHSSYHSLSVWRLARTTYPGYRDLLTATCKILRAAACALCEDSTVPGPHQQEG